jgi:HEAT repeat protein
MTKFKPPELSPHSWSNRKRLFIGVLCLFLAGNVTPQELQNRSAHVTEAMQKLKQGDFVGVDVEEIARAGAVEALPDLKDKFARTLTPRQESALDPGDKAEIASALVRLGEKKPMYWDFLVNFASETFETDIPSPNAVDAQGKTIRGKFSSDLLAWATAHGESPESATQRALYEFPAKLSFLAKTGDPRALPLLKGAMLSPDYAIQAMAAKGLAKLQDKDSIDLIVQACEKNPSEAAAVIAQALLFFDDPKAQTAADMYVDKDIAKYIRERRSLPGIDPFFY